MHGIPGSYSDFTSVFLHYNLNFCVSTENSFSKGENTEAPKQEDSRREEITRWFQIDSGLRDQKLLPKPS